MQFVFYRDCTLLTASCNITRLYVVYVVRTAHFLHVDGVVNFIIQRRVARESYSAALHGVSIVRWKPLQRFQKGGGKGVGVDTENQKVER